MTHRRKWASHRQHANSIWSNEHLASSVQRAPRHRLLESSERARYWLSANCNEITASRMNNGNGSAIGPTQFDLEPGERHPHKPDSQNASAGAIIVVLASILRYLKHLCIVECISRLCRALLRFRCRTHRNFHRKSLKCHEVMDFRQKKR